MEDKIVVKKLPKSPGLAGVLAFFFPFGVGPLYNGQYRKALIYFFIFAGLADKRSQSAILRIMLGWIYFLPDI